MLDNNLNEILKQFLSYCEVNEFGIFLPNENICYVERLGFKLHQTDDLNYLLIGLGLTLNCFNMSDGYDIQDLISNGQEALFLTDLIEE